MKNPALHTRLALSALTMASVSGCAIVAEQYTPAPDKETAFLRVVAQGTASLPPRTSVFTFSQPERCEGRKWIYNETRPGQERVLPNGFAPIESGKPFSLLIMTQTEATGTQIRFCAPVATFVPVARRHYLVEESHGAGQCFLRITSSETPSMANAQMAAFTKKKFQRGFDESSSWCQPE